MKCDNCKNEIDNDSKFCSFCRSKIESNYKIIFLSKQAIRLWLLLIGAFLLVIALLGIEERTLEDYMRAHIWSLGSDFYIFLRLYIFCVSTYFIFMEYKNKRFNTAFIFIAMAIIFNPFILFRFNNIENLIELFATGFFSYFAYQEYKNRKIK